MTNALDPAKTSSTITLTNSNLTATRTSGANYYGSALSNSSSLVGDIYVEVPSATVTNSAFGVSNALIADSSDGSSNFLGADGNSIGCWGGGDIYYGGALVGSFVTPLAPGDTIGVWVDRTTKQLWFYNVATDVWMPSPGAGYDISSLGTGPLYFGFTLYQELFYTVNFDGTFEGVHAPGFTRWDGAPVNPVFYTLPAATGPRVLTRIDAVLKRTRIMPAVVRAFVVTGIVTALSRIRKVVADTRATVLTGIAAVLVKSGGARQLVADVGVVVLSGKDTALQYARRMVADQGVATLTGLSAGLAAARKMIADAGAFLLTGNAASLLHARIVGAVQGTIALTGVAANLIRTAANRLVADTGTLALVGHAAILVRTTANRLVADAGTFLLTGLPADLVHAVTGGYTLTVAPGVISMSGKMTMLRVHRELPPPGVLRFGIPVYRIPGQW